MKVPRNMIEKILVVLAVMTVFTGPAAAEITKGPYLQNPGKTEMTVMWEADKPAKAAVHYGEKQCDQKLEVKRYRTAGRTNKTYWFEAKLENLKPGTAYKYYVETGGKKSGESTFRTAPEKEEKFTFIAYGDTRGSASIHSSLASKFLAHSPAFIIHGGDLVRSGRFESQVQDKFFNPLRKVICKVPFWATRGNHDGRESDFLQYFSFPGGRTYYSFDYANAHFICLDSYKSEKMYQWCKKDLAGSKADWKIVFFHVPMYNAGGHSSSAWRGKMLRAFHKYGVDVVFAADSHLYERFYPIRPASYKKAKPITHIVTAGGSAPLYSTTSHPYLAASAKVYHYMVFTIDGKKLSAKAINVSGKVIDKFSFSREGDAYNAEYMKLLKKDPKALRKSGL